MQAGEEAAAIRAIAREGDPDRYAAALFVPRPARDHLFALYAFNVELARVSEQVSEPQLGEIRLEWWREALTRASAGEATGHPVADALGRAARAYALPGEALQGLIDARHFDVSVKVMPDEAALDDYLAKSAGALFALAAATTSAGAEGPAVAPEEIDAAAKAACIAYGLTGLMRALPVHLARGRIDLPADALLRHGVSPARLLAGETTEGLLALLTELRANARSALAEARRRVAPLPPRTRSAFLPLALVEPYLDALEKARDPLREIVYISPLHRLWRLGTHRFH